MMIGTTRKRFACNVFGHVEIAPWKRLQAKRLGATFRVSGPKNCTFDQGIQRVLRWCFGHPEKCYRQSVWELFRHAEIAAQNR